MRGPTNPHPRREYFRVYMQQRHARGVCARCGKPLPPNYTGWRHYECAKVPVKHGGEVVTP